MTSPLARTAALCAIALGLTVALPRAAPAQQPEPLATQDELQQLYKDGKYPLVLQKLQRVLLLKGAAARPYDRHALLVIKGESHLRMKQTAPASQAFRDAAAETELAEKKALDLATAELIRRSPPLTYTPKSKDRAKEGPIDIVDVDSRKRALSALFEDERAAAEPKVRAARDGQQLSKLLDVLPAVRGVRALELASTGGDAQTRKMIGDLAAHAQNLLGEAVKGMAKSTDDIEKIANEWIAVDNITPGGPTGVRTDRRWRRRGPDTRDQGTLRETVENCTKIAPACRDLAEALAAGESEFGAIRLEAERVGRKAHTVLTDDYKRTVSRPPR